MAQKPQTAALATYVDPAKAQQFFKEVISKQIKTSGKEIKRKRVELSSLSIQVQTLIARALGSKLIADGEYAAAKDVMNAQDFAKFAAETITAEDRDRCINLANMLAMQGIFSGIELICDMLSWEQTVEIKGTKKLAKRRLSLAEMVQHLTYMIGGPDGVMDMQNDTMCMTNDIGIKQSAFYDERGVLCPTKYLEPDPATDKDEVVAVEEGEALTDEEAERITATDVTADVLIQKVKGKK